MGRSSIINASLDNVKTSLNRFRGLEQRIDTSAPLPCDDCHLDGKIGARRDWGKLKMVTLCNLGRAFANLVVDDGARSIGDCGKFHGRGIYRFASGKSEEGEYRNDKPVGAHIARYPDGRVSTNQYR